MPYIVTLSGSHRQPEYMDGWLTDLTHKSPVAYLWRPSKISTWMAPVGGAIASVGAAITPTGVGAIIGVPMMLVGGAMTVGGTVGSAIYADDQKKKAIKQHDTLRAQAIEASKKKNLMIGGALLATVAGVYVATR
jgi:hypothetical protein